MNLKLIGNGIETEIACYEGISLTQYQQLVKRLDEILSIVHKRVFEYINDDDLCFDDCENLFPAHSKLTGNYYIDSVSYINYVNPAGFQITI
ncbi:hypothetical protein [Metabacillus fastidiosus]|uniref:hypothetical protein n=1 Tax=Metabacillus fastidiosus TaxID=1458 RepID=UPI003D2B7852